MALAANVALLLGCTALKTLQDATNRPSTSPTPTPVAKSTTAAPAASPPGPTATPVSLLERAREVNRAAEGRTQARNDAREKAIDAITAAQERAVGQATAFNIITSRNGVLLEEGLVRYVNDVANIVASVGERTDEAKGKDKIARVKARRFFVGILNSDSMDAFSMPGGYILVSRGLLENLTSESDLAWVLGHEIAHIDNEDGLGAMKATINFQIAAGKEPNLDDPAFFGIVADKLSEFLYRTGYDRALEAKADRRGLEYAVRAGYDPQGARRVLELLGVNTANHKFTLLSSHDTPQRRLEALAADIDRAPKGKLGIERYDREAARRLEAAKASASPAN